MARLVVDHQTLVRHRLHANHLGERLPAGSLAMAAFAGLQDSAPRAAIVALHARAHGVSEEDWEHHALVQTWAPRGAVFVVPRDDLAVFALGITPRDADVRRVLDPLVERARRSLREPRVKGREAADLGPLDARLRSLFRRGPAPRLVFALAGAQLRWDARKTSVLPGTPFQMDEEDARRELARRFLRSLGPAEPKHFTRWAAVSASDARETFDAIDAELTEVDCADGTGLVLSEDVDRLVSAVPVGGVRFVPFGGDPVLQPGDGVVQSHPSNRRSALPPWASTGLIVHDGQVVAGWGRSQGRVSVRSLRAGDPGRRRQIEEEASSMPFVESAVPLRWR